MLINSVLIVTVSYIIGIILGVYFNWSILFVFILFSTIGVYMLKNYRKIILFCISVVLASMCYTCYLNQKYYNLYNNLDNVRVVGTIVSECKEKEYKYIYKVKVSSVNDDCKYKNTTLYLNIKKSKFENEKLKYGDLIEFSGEYKIPNTQRNYKGDDYSFFIKTQKIYGTFETSVNNIKIVKNKNSNFIDISINNVSNKIKDNLSSVLTKENAEIAIAILLGDKQNVEENVLKMFKNGNLYHILAVSGMHISYIIIGFSLLNSKIGKRKMQFFMIFFLIFSINLTGNTPSVMRAGISSVLMLIASLAHKKSDGINNLCVSLLIILIMNPFSLFEIGCILSYGGTIGIITFCNYIENKFLRKFPQGRLWDFIKDTIAVSISANIIILPIMMYKFNTIPLIFVISNLLISPLIGVTICLIVITAIVSFASLKLAGIVAFFLNAILWLFLRTVELINFFTFFNITVPTPNIIVIIIIYIILSVLIFNKEILKKYKYILKKVFYVLLIIEIIVRLVSFLPSDVKIYFIDVSQGDSTLIISEYGKKVLIDGGGSEMSDFDVGEKVLLPYLLDRGILSIDYLMVSHFDADHCKGTFTILESLKVKNVIISEQGDSYENYKIFEEIVKRKHINVIIVKQGDIIKIDKSMYFEILWPQSKQISENMINNNSIVCKLKFNDFSMLFTGDIEELAEKIIIQQYGDHLESDILKVAHHGSKSSSTQEFLDCVNCRVSIIGVGESNNFGHPNRDVLERLQGINSKILRTDVNGEIMINVKRNGKICTSTQISE